MMYFWSIIVMKKINNKHDCVNKKVSAGFVNE